MKMFVKREFILIGILVLAAVLRIWSLTGVPPSASMDEASIGYNAYSVASIGVDEYGDFPLISQRGYDDWRRSTYLLLVTPFVRLFGLNVTAIRLPAILLSVLTVWAVYHIVLLLFTKRTTFSYVVASLTAVLLAVSPWHVYISRLGHESNAYLSFGIFGVLFFLQGVRNKTKFLLSMTCFTLSIISYYAGQVFIPFVGLGLVIWHWSSLDLALRVDKKFRLSFILVALLCIAFIRMTFSGSAIVRFGGTSTFKPDAHYQEYTKRMERYHESVARGDLVGRIRNSKYLFPIEVFVSSYASHFNVKWLFVNSGNEPFKAPNMGLLYLWQLPLILIGIVVFFRHRDLDLRAKKMIILWFLLSPLPGSIATQAPHAMRTYPSVFTWQLFSAFGLVYVLSGLLKQKTLVIIAAFLVLVLGSLIGLYKNYFVAFPKEQSRSFHYAFSKVIPYVLSEENKYEKVVFSNEDNLYQSYMLFLYYSQFDPILYQREGGTRSGGYAEEHAFGKYEFRPIIKNEELAASVLYIGGPDDFTRDVTLIEEFRNLDGTIAILAVTSP